MVTGVFSPLISNLQGLLLFTDCDVFEHFLRNSKDVRVKWCTSASTRNWGFCRKTRHETSMWLKAQVSWPTWLLSSNGGPLNRIMNFLKKIFEKCLAWFFPVLGFSGRPGIWHHSHPYKFILWLTV